MHRVDVLLITLAWVIACCPIPLKRTVTVRPELDVQVVDAEGHPAEVTLTVRRNTNGPPPDSETHRWTEAVPDGHVLLPYLEQSETYAPLMMHGVTWYEWEVCATGAAGAASHRIPGMEPIEPHHAVRLVLDPTQTDCGWEEFPPFP